MGIRRTTRAKRATTRRSAHGLLAGVVLAVSVLAACGGGNGASGDGEGGELTDVTVGVLPIADVAPLYVGIEQGFFEEEGLRVEPQIAQTGAAITTGVVSGDFDLGFAAAIIMILANAEGLPVRIVATGNQAALDAEDAWAGIMIPSDGPIEEPADLEGETVAVNALEGTVQLTMLAALEEEGVDTSAIDFLEIPFPDMPTALAEGQVRAAGAVEPFVTSVEQQGGELLLPYLHTVEPGMTIGTYFTHENALGEQSDLIERFAAAINRSLEYTRDNEQEARDAIADYTETPPEVLSEIALPLWRSELNPQSIQLQADLAQEFGFTDDRVDASELIWQGAQGS